MARWTEPGLLSDSRPTKGLDCFPLGVIVRTVLSGLRLAAPSEFTSLLTIVIPFSQALVVVFLYVSRRARRVASTLCAWALRERTRYPTPRLCATIPHVLNTTPNPTKFIDEVHPAVDVWPEIQIHCRRCAVKTGGFQPQLYSSQGGKRGYVAAVSGRLTDIWQGEYYGSYMTYKTFRIYPTQNLKEAKEVGAYTVSEVCQGTKTQDSSERAPTWWRLSHQNILSFRGATTTLFRLALVHDWGHNRDVTWLVASNPRASWYGIARYCGNSGETANLFSLRTAAAWCRERAGTPSFA